MKILNLQALCLLFALWSCSAVAAFYPVNRGMVNQATYVVTAAGTTTAVATSNQVYVFTGSSTQTLKLPNATGLPVDWWYEAINNSTGTVTVTDSTSASIVSLTAGRAAKIILRDKTTAAGTWASWSAASVSDLANYYLKSEFINSSTGAPDANKPVKTNSSGLIDTTMLPGGGSSWGVTGNSGTSAGTNFIGNTDAVDLVFKTSATERFRITSSGGLNTQLGTGLVKSTAGVLGLGVSGTDYQTPISTDAAVSNQFLTGFTAPNTFTRAQPSVSNISGTSADWLSQYLLLAGRSGGQTAYGGTGASDLMTLRSTSNGTVGSVVIADQTGEKTRIGPTGSASTFNNTHEFLITGGSNSATDGLVVRRNNLAAFHAGSGTTNAAGIALLPRGPSAAPEIRFSSTGGDQDAYIRLYDTGFGNLYGYFAIGSTFKIMNSNAALVPFWVSGTTGQSVPLQKWSNQSDGGNFVSQVAKDGHFQGPNGSASVPAFGFLNDTNTGMYGDGADALKFATGGSDRVTISSAGAVRLHNYGAGTLVTDASGNVTAATVTSTLTVSTKTANYTLTNSDDVIIFNCSSACTLTLQAVSGATQKRYSIKNIGIGSVTINRAGSDTIDGDTGYFLPPGSAPFPAVELIPNGGTAWYVF